MMTRFSKPWSKEICHGAVVSQNGSLLDSVRRVMPVCANSASVNAGSCSMRHQSGRSSRVCSGIDGNLPNSTALSQYRRFLKALAWPCRS